MDYNIVVVRRIREEMYFSLKVGCGKKINLK